MASETSPWIGAELEQWKALTQKRTPRLVKKKTALYQQQDDAKELYIVKEGRICITTFHHDGSERQLYIAETGALFGERSCILNQPHSTAAVAIVDSQVYAVPYSDVRGLLAADNELCQAIMRHLCRKNTVLKQQVIELSFSSAVQRIAQILIYLADMYGVLTPAGIEIPIRFSHQDVANIMTTSRVTVNNTFTLFKSEGILAKRNGKTIITNIEKLNRIAEPHCL